MSMRHFSSEMNQNQSENPNGLQLVPPKSCIQHPNLEYIALRPEYLGILPLDCKGETRRCAAAILSKHEREHNLKLKKPNADGSLYVYKTQAERKADLLNEFGERAIGAAYKVLVKAGFLTTRRNPKHGWDRTIQYLFQAKAVQDAVNNWSNALLVIKVFSAAADKAQKCGLHDANLRTPNRKNAEAIPVLSSVLSSNESNPSFAQSPDGSAQDDVFSNSSSKAEPEKNRGNSSTSKESGSSPIPSSAAPLSPAMPAGGQTGQVKMSPLGQSPYAVMKAFIDVAAPDGQLPAGKRISSYTKHGKTLVEDGVTTKEMSEAGELVNAYRMALPSPSSLSAVLQWQVGEVNNLVSTALALSKDGITPQDVSDFVKFKYSEKDSRGYCFWAGQVMDFKGYLRRTIGAWKAENQAKRGPKMKTIEVFKEDCPYCHGIGIRYDEKRMAWHCECGHIERVPIEQDRVRQAAISRYRSEPGPEDYGV